VYASWIAYHGCGEHQKGGHLHFKIDELARLVHPRDGHQKILAVIDAYIDESGIHDGAPACVVGGYFGGHSAWRNFEREWRKTLQNFSVPLDQFHASEFLSKKGFFWDMKIGQYQEFRERITLMILRQKIYPITVGLIVNDFKIMTILQRRFLTGARVTNGRLVTSGCPNRPYFLPFQTWIRRAVSYAPQDGKVHCFFGLDRPFAKYASALYSEMKNSGRAEYGRLGDPSFPMAKETPQLQVADLLACLSFQHMRERMKEGNWNVAPNRLLTACLSRNPVHPQQKRPHPDDHTFYDSGSLQAALRTSYEISGHWDGTTPIPAFESEDENRLPENATTEEEGVK
jgi:hypothetical protein